MAKGKRFATCPKCGERFVAAPDLIMVDCPKCDKRFNSIKINNRRYVQPGAYLYSFIVAGKNDDLLPRHRPEDLTPEGMKRVALDSLYEDLDDK